MIRNLKRERTNGQTAMEYMLLTGIVVVVVLVGFNIFVPRTFDISDEFFNVVTNHLMDTPPNADFLMFTGN